MQLNCINQVRVPPVDAKVPLDVWTTLEVASPEVLYKTSIAEWHSITIDERSFEYTCVHCTDPDRDVYVMTFRKDMFNSLVNTCDYNDWLLRFGNELFVVMYPVLHERRISLSFVPKQNYEIIPTQEQDEIVRHLYGNRAYTVCSGRTLFLAFHRLGLLNKRDVLLALVAFGNGEIAINNDHIFLYVHNPIIHVADNDLTYACMGVNKAHVDVITYLSLCHSSPPYNVQYINHGTMVYTVPVIAALPQLHKSYMNILNVSKLWTNCRKSGKDHVLCLYSILQHMSVSRKVNRMYCSYDNSDLKSLFLSYADEATALSMILTRLFHMYTHAVKHHRRIRMLWMSVIKMVDNRVLHSFMNKYVILLYLKTCKQLPTTWLPDPPIAFFKDVINLTDIDFFASKVRAPVEMGADTSIYKVMSMLPETSPTKKFCIFMERKINQRWSTLCLAANRDKAICDALEEYFMRNKQSLYA